MVDIQDTPVEQQEGQQPTETTTAKPDDKLREEGNSQAIPDRVPGNTADEHLPVVTFAATAGEGDTPPPPPPETKPDEPKPRALNDETIKKYADELHSAVNRENWHGGDDPDKDKIFQLLNSLGEADRKALEAAYVNAKGNSDHKSLRSELERRMDGDDWRKAEARLNTRDNRTNDAGNLMVSLSAINDNRGDAERRIIETFAILNSEQRKNLYADFQKDYGMSVDEALKKFGVSEDGMKALTFINKPVDQRSAQEIEDFARFAVDKGNLDYLSVALRGDTPAAKEARTKLQNDQEFNKKLIDAFKPKEEGGVLGVIKQIGDFALGPLDEIVSGIVNGDLTFGKVLGGTQIGEAFTSLMSAVDAKEENIELLTAIDILREGRPSLATIALNNTGSLFGWFDNKDNIKLAVDNATDTEKQAFLRGRELVGRNPDELSAEDKGNLAYYERLHKAFGDAGEDRETALWEAKLLYGKDSLQAKIADTDKKDGQFSAIENMTQQEWEALKDPAKRKEFEQFLSQFVNEGDRKRMLEIVDGKTSKETFEQSQEVKRTVSELIKHNTDDGIFSTSYNGKNIVAGLEKLSPEEAQKYKEDPAYKAEIDKFVREKLNNQERNYAEHMLRQVAATGKPPEQDAIGKVLANSANGADVKAQLTGIEELLQSDPELRKRLSGDINALTPAEKALRQAIDSAFDKIIMKTSEYQATMNAGEYGPSQQQMEALDNKEKAMYDSLWQTGRLPVDMKADLNLKNQSFFVEAAKVSPEERERLFKSGKITNEERKLIEKVAEQGGQMNLEDKMRSYILGDGSDPAEFKDELRKLTGEQKQLLKEAYVKKYDSALEDDLLGKIDKKEQQTFKNLLTPSSVDGRQDYYDNLEEWLKSRSGGGLAPDGTALTVERAMTDQGALQQWFNSRFEKMPPDVQEAANAYFKEALEQHKESKAKMAELLATIAITAAALAATPFTGGASLALASIAFVAGGVAKVAIHRAVEGGDYDWNKALGHFVGGGTEGALNVIGGRIVEGMFKGFNVAGNTLYAGMLSKGLVGEGTEAVTGRAFTKLIAAGKDVTEANLDEFVKAVAPGADAATAASIKNAAKEAVVQNYDAIINRATTVALATVDNAAIGGASSAADVVVRATIDGRPITADEVLSAVLVGAATGAVVGGVIRGGIEARDIHITARRGPNGEHILMPSTNPDKPVVIESADGTRRTVTEPTAIKPGERIVDGPEPAGAVPLGASDVPGVPPKNNGPQAGPHDGAGANVNGVDMQFYENRLRLGSDFGLRAPGVSRDHAVINYDPISGEFKFKDTSSYGTFVRREGSNNWEFVRGREVTVKPGDEIRLGAADGPQIKLNAPNPMTVTKHGGNPDVRLFLGDKPVDLDAEGNMIVGRDVRGADGQPIIQDRHVSRDHGKLRYDKATDTYYYTDNGSTNGTYINGQRIEAGKEVAVKPTDDVRLGGVEGTQLKLVSMKPETKINGAQDAAVYVGGKEIPVGPDGRVPIGRNDQLGQGITDTRVSRDHGSLRWNEADKSFYYTDHNSTNGTFIFRDGQYHEIPRGQEIKISPDDDIRLGSTDGPRLELFNKNSGSRSEFTQKQVYFNGAPVNFDGNTGEIRVGRGHQNIGDSDPLNRLVSVDHGTLKVDPDTGNMVYTDKSTNGTYIRRLDGTVEAVRGRSVTVRPGEEIHLGSENGPVLKLTETPGRKLPDGSTLYRNPDGDLIVRPDRTSVLDDRAGIRTTRDADGNVTEVMGPGRGLRYEYGQNNELRKVTFNDGTTYESLDGQTWKIKGANQPETEWRGKMTVEPDGSIRFNDGTNPPVVRRIDGSEEVHWTNGHVEYRNANINVEAQRIEALIRYNYPDQMQADRMRSLVRDLQNRPDISVQGKADALHQINRLLTGGNDASIPLATRTRLAEQVTFNAAHPEWIDQGINKTCNVTTVEARAYQRSPSDAIRLVTDVSLTGKFTTASGKTVDVARVGTLTPDKESLTALQQPYRNGWNDLKADGARSFASQIFEQTSINVHYAINPQAASHFSGVTIQPGDIVAYKKVDVPSGSADTGERLVIYRIDANGRQVEIPAGDAPNLRLSDIEGVYNQVVPGRDAQGNIAPGQEQSIVWASPAYTGDNTGWRIQNEQQLLNNLLQAQQQGHLPIILTVNANHPLINNGNPRAGHAWHVINVQKITVVNGVPMVEFTNQWGTQFNHLGPGRAVPLRDLYAAMQ